MVLAFSAGDVDGDGKVGSTDYVLVRKHILGQSLLSGDMLERADVNNDGKISSMDFVLIRKTIINKETVTPTAVPTNGEEYKISYYVTLFKETGYNIDIVIDKSSIMPFAKSGYFTLKKEKKYVISFDYIAKEEAEFSIGLYYKDDKEKVKVVSKKITATNTLHHYNLVVPEIPKELDTYYIKFENKTVTDKNKVTISNFMVGKYKEVTKKSGETLGDLPSASRTNFEFLGWYTSKDGNEKVDENTPVTSDMILYSHWKNKLTYIKGPGGDNYSKTVTYQGRTFTEYLQQKFTYKYGGGTIAANGCGPMSLASILSGYMDVDPEEVARRTNLPASFDSIKSAASKYGFEYTKFYSYNSNDFDKNKAKGLAKEAVRLLKDGYQLIVLVSGNKYCEYKKTNCNGLRSNEYTVGNHFMAVVAVEDDDDTVQILNPIGKRNNGSMFELIYYFMPSGGKGFIGFRKK